MADKPETVVYPVRIPRPLYERFVKLANAEHTTIVWQILHALRERFKQPGRKK